MRYDISCLIVSSTLQPLLVHVWSLVVLIYPLVVFVFPFPCPLVAVVCPLLVHVCQLVVLVCLFFCPLLVPVSQVVVLVWLFVCLLVVRYVGLFIGDGYSHPIAAVSFSEIGFDSNNENSHSFTKSLSTLFFTIHKHTTSENIFITTLLCPRIKRAPEIERNLSYNFNPFIREFIPPSSYDIFWFKAFFFMQLCTFSTIWFNFLEQNIHIRWKQLNSDSIKELKTAFSENCSLELTVKIEPLFFWATFLQKCSMWLIKVSSPSLAIPSIFSSL